MPRTRKQHAAAYLDNVLVLREKTNHSARRALNMARATQKNYNGIRAANETYRAAIDRAARAILFPPTPLHFGIYSRIVDPIRFEETRAIVHARLPTDALRAMIAQHANHANQVATLAQRMAEQARRLRMNGPFDNAERRAAMAAMQKINQNASRLEAPQEAMERIEAEDQAFEVIRAFSALSTFQFTLHTSSDPANKYKGRRLKVGVLVARSGIAPTPFEIPPMLVRDNLPVLTKWVEVSQHLIAAMKRASPPATLQINGTKDRAAMVEEFRVENLIATYKITALVAWLAWKGRELVPKMTRAPSKEELKEEVKALDAEILFYGVFREWLSFFLQHRPNPVGKREMERQLALLMEAEKQGGWIALRKEHVKLKRLETRSAPSRSTSPTRATQYLKTPIAR